MFGNEIVALTMTPVDLRLSKKVGTVAVEVPTLPPLKPTGPIPKILSSQDIISEVDVTKNEILWN